MTTEVTIPLLPCHSINEVRESYRALGFEVTYQQAKPSAYAVVCRGGMDTAKSGLYYASNDKGMIYSHVVKLDSLQQ